MSEETPNPAPVPETPPAAPNPTTELAAVKDELAALRAEIAELAKAKPEIPSVPTTETPPPAITPKAPDTSGLPVHARMAAGYSK